MACASRKLSSHRTFSQVLRVVGIFTVSQGSERERALQEKLLRTKLQKVQHIISAAFTWLSELLRQFGFKEREFDSISQWESTTAIFNTVHPWSLPFPPLGACGELNEIVSR